MKKYFVKGIEDEPLEYGDVVGVDLVKESDDKTKTITRHVEVPFTSDTEDMLLDLEVIEEKEVEENEPSVEDVIKGNTDADGCSVEEAIDNIDESISEIADILAGHQTIIKNLKHRVETLESKRKPIDIFNPYPFQPTGSMLRFCL